MFDADLTMEEIERPLNGWCFTGHNAPEVWRRNGAGTPEETMKFYSVSGKISGIYCECCIIIAKALAQQNKKNKG